MRSLTLMLAFCAGGCYCSHTIEPVDAAGPVTDAGLLPDVLVPDASSDAGSDAGGDAGLPDGGYCSAPMLVIERWDDLWCWSDLQLGDTDRGIWGFAFWNRTSREMRVLRMRVHMYRGAPEDCALRTLRRIDLQDRGGPLVMHGSEMPVSSADGYYEVVFHPDDLRIPPGRRYIVVDAELATYLDGGCSGWGTGFWFVPQNDLEVVWEDGGDVPRDAICSFNADGLPFGTFDTVRMETRRVSLGMAGAGVSSTRIASGEQEIGRFTGFAFANAGNYSATVDALGFGFEGVFGGDMRPRSLRVYRDVVSPETLLASRTFPDGQLPPTSWSSEEFADVAVAPGTPVDFILTFDADGIFPGAFVRTDLVTIRWSDGVTSSTRIGVGDGGCRVPIVTGTTTSFAPAP